VVDVKDCKPCVVCGSTDVHMIFNTGAFGDSLCAIRCSNKKCHIMGKESLQKATAIKYWNRLKEIHDQQQKAQ
jgi:hypothetical protein